MGWGLKNPLRVDWNVEDLEDVVRCCCPEEVVLCPPRAFPANVGCLTDLRVFGMEKED